MGSRDFKARIYLPILASIWAGLPILAQAQMGKTREQCDTRYGKAETAGAVKSNPDKQIALYRKDGFEILVSFRKGRANQVLYQKVNKAEFGADELQSFLAENKGSSSWAALPPLVEPDEDGKPVLVWERTDGIAASYHYDEDEKARILVVWITEEEKNRQ